MYDEESIHRGQIEEHHSNEGELVLYHTLKKITPSPYMTTILNTQRREANGSDLEILGEEWETT